jgi:hypothetical protein
MIRVNAPWRRSTRGFARTFVRGSLALLVVVSRPAFAQEASGAGEVERLRQELGALRAEYAARIEALETRLQALEAGRQTQPAPAAAPPQAEVPAGASGAGGPESPLPVYGAAASSSKIFNPDIAVIGDFLGAAGTNSADPQPALDFHEAETSFQAIVDPYARADFFLAFNPEGVEVEEGFITFPTLPAGLLMKVGKLRSAFGKVNTMHNHVLPWTDRPLVTRNLVGGEEGISDAGVSISRLFPNRFVFLEATGEAYRGESTLFKAESRGDLTYVGRLRAYRDLTESSNLDVGGSFAYGHREASATLGSLGGQDVAGSATRRLFGVDATFRYRPLRRAIYTRVLGRTELVWSRLKDPFGARNAFGMYGYGEYQFARRWFGGLRYDYSERDINPSLKDKGGSLLLTFWPSEFSQVRAQLRRTKYAEGNMATELLFQFLFSIGAHGAHPF